MSYYNRQNKSTKVVKKDLEPTEDSIHFALVDWLATVPYKDKTLLDVTHHSPMGGTASARQKSKFKKMGAKSGWPDIQISVAKGCYHGLYVELKRSKGGVVSANQKEILTMLDEEGYCTTVARGYDKAVEVVKQYMALEDGESMPE